MEIILSHPTGNANSKEAASSLKTAGILAEYHTTVATFSGDLADRLGAFPPFATIRRRRLDSQLRGITRTSPWREMGRQFFLKAGFENLIKHETGYFSVDAVYRGHDKNVASRLGYLAKAGKKGIYAYEDGAAFSFRKAKQLGLQCFYDLPIGYWRAARKLLQEEYNKHPEWAATLTGFHDSNAKLERKDEELHLADRIFVASNFTATSLKEYEGELAPVEVIPYGFPPVVKSREYTPVSARPLKLLFVGGLSQRKGIAELFEAVKGLEHRVELTIVGRKPIKSCKALDVALARHRWFPSLSHEEVLKLMRGSDVLVFPSLFEGFGLVITEAMSQGTPVITTNRTAGPDIILHDQNGWLVEAGSASAIKNCIEALLSTPGKIAEAGKLALETARSRSWQVYGYELALAIKRHLKENPFLEK